jgi:hypothetical protein
MTVELAQLRGEREREKWKEDNQKFTVSKNNIYTEERD